MLARNDNVTDTLRNAGNGKYVVSHYRTAVIEIEALVDKTVEGRITKTEAGPYKATPAQVPFQSA